MEIVTGVIFVCGWIAIGLGIVSAIAAFFVDDSADAFGLAAYLIVAGVVALCLSEPVAWLIGWLADTNF